MSTATSKGKPAETSRVLNAKPKPRTMTPDQRRQMTIIGIAVAVVLGMGAVIFAYFNKPEIDPTPRLNSGIERIVPFIASRDFDKLEFARQVLYWKELAGKKKEIEAMFTSGKINKDQYREVLSVVWIGNRFKHIERYFSLGDLDRKDYLDKFIDSDLAGPTKASGAILKDDNRIKAMIQTFPGEVREGFDQFHQAIADRKKERRAEAKAIKQAAKNTVPASPAPRGADRPAITSPAGAKPAPVAPK